MPQRKNLDRRLRFFDDAVVQVVPDPGEMHAPHSGQRRIARSSAEAWLQGEKCRSLREIVAEYVRCLRPIGPPPIVRDPNLFGRELADDDRKRFAQSSLRRSERTLSRGIVRPPSHCAIASRKA